MSKALAQPQEPELPNSVDSEQELLGSILADPKAASFCHELEAGEFFEPLHGRIYAVAMEQFRASGGCFPTVIIAKLKGDETLADIGLSPSEYVGKLMSARGVIAAVPWLVKQIKNDAMLRRIASTANSVASEALRPEMGSTAIDVASRAIDAITKISSGGLGGGRKSSFTIGQAADEVTARVSDVMQSGVVPDNAIYCGADALQEVFGGFGRGRYYVIAGRPSMGKTTVGAALLFEASKRGSNVAFFSLEMTAHELAERIIAAEASTDFDRIEYRWISRNDMRGDQYDKIRNKAHDVASVPFFIEDSPGLTIAQVRSRSMQLKQRLEGQGKTLDAICIDHIGLMKASERYAGNKVAETEEISTALKVMAKELNIPVIGLCQLNRGVEGRDDKRPSLADLRWSGAIEQDADAVMFCFRESYYLERKANRDLAEDDRLRTTENTLELIVAKNRGGACPVVTLYCDMGCAIVRDQR